MSRSGDDYFQGFLRRESSAERLASGRSHAAIIAGFGSLLNVARQADGAALIYMQDPARRHVDERYAT